MHKYGFIINKLDGRSLFRLLMGRIFSINYYYVVKLNLNSPRQKRIKRDPPGDLSIMNSDDLSSIKNTIEFLGADDKREILARIIFYESGFRNCYVVKVDGNIVYLQWLIYPSENDIIKKYYKNIFHPLNNKTVIIENVFTYPKFRGIGYLPYFSQKLLDIVHKQGYRTAVGYIKNDKIISLNEFYQMGFKATKLLRERKLFGSIHRNL
ncbi:hypothetical protein H8E88_02805 [candidate division KSB1 bacterium]|nr:hypothetical protein [candidate division KSB1 bacterium]MBL7093233.1 hypothetical protein [candidate division KSB1 bacterium]